ncbi:hypothetical protein GCM10022198_20400 [Klugiella xanthotipulae]|uniref:Uncharacterized protein DUF4184 n=1 Tax=Klugiella xanthotipulae TaxID=244735 RepID=A0A543I645_9MICO|nr:DUF4184 family protein [Klugiella xanthotipulae]TQM66076.1 uncharacterized protein DUF4184 [Klugiella xanthotipulae]
MPFTPSHAIVAIPFQRTGIPVAAVAIGAMAPDLPIFFDLGVSYETTHEFPGLLLAALPLAALLTLVWRVLLRPVAWVLLPTPLARRLPADWAGTARDGWRSLTAGRGAVGGLLLVAGLLLGVASHVLWDEFTHGGRWGVALLPALGRDWAGMPGYLWAQYASSLLGLIVLAGWAARALRRATPVATLPPTPGWLQPAFWAGLVAALLLGAVIVLPAVDVLGWRFAILRMGIRGGAGILVVIVIAAGVAQAVRRRMPTAATPAPVAAPESR